MESNVFHSRTVVDTHHTPPCLPSYHTNFQNATLATTDMNTSISVTLTHTYSNRMLSSHDIRPGVALSPADSIVLPSRGLAREPPSISAITTSQLERTAVSAYSTPSKSTDATLSVAPIPDRFNLTSVDTELTHCAPEVYYTILSSLCNSLSSSYDGPFAQCDHFMGSRVTSGVVHRTTLGSYVETRESSATATHDSGCNVESGNAKPSKLGGQEDRSTVTTEVPSTTDPYIPATFSSVTRTANMSLAPPVTINSSRIWSPTGHPNMSTGTEVSSNGSLPVPGAPPSVPPELASIGHAATSRHIFVLVCLWTMAMLYS
jgi:hypothetical protein